MSKLRVPKRTDNKQDLIVYPRHIAKVKTTNSKRLQVDEVRFNKEERELLGLDDPLQELMD